MQKTKQGKTARQRRKERQRVEMRNAEEAKLLAEDPVADETAKEKEYSNDELDLDIFEKDDGDLEENDLSDDDELTPEEQKDYIVSDAVVVETGPTSFAELDAIRKAQDKAREIEQVTWDTERILRNIVRDPLMDASEKASAISKVGAEMPARVKEAVSKDFDPDFDYEQAQADFDKRQAKPEGVINTLKSLVGVDAEPEQKANSFMISKALDGNWRWFGWVSNNFLDREDEIISEKAHKTYVEFLDANPQFAPKFCPWHTFKAMRENPVDFWDYTNGFLVMGGSLTDKEAQGLLRAGAKHKLGMSHSYYTLERNTENKAIIDKYLMIESGELPLESAANPWTNFEMKEVLSMNKKKKAYLELLHGEEFADIVEKETAEMQEALQEEEIPSKDVKDEVDEAAADMPESENKSDETPTDATEEVFEQLVKAVFDKVSKQLDLDALKEFMPLVQKAIEEELPALKQDVAATQKSKDEALAEAISPPIEGIFSYLRPSQKEDSEIEEKEAEELGAPTPGKLWLTEGAGIPPLPKDAVEKVL